MLRKFPFYTTLLIAPIVLLQIPTTSINYLSGNIKKASKKASKKGSCYSSGFEVLTKSSGQREFAWAVFKDENAKNCENTASASKIACIFYVTV